MDLNNLHSIATSLEGRLAALESKGVGSGIPAGHVADLQDLRTLLVAAQEETQALTKERDQAVKAAAAAAAEVTKLNYRILHLTRSLREEKQKAAA